MIFRPSVVGDETSLAIVTAVMVWNTINGKTGYHVQGEVYGATGIPNQYNVLPKDTKGIQFYGFNRNDLTPFAWIYLEG